MYQERISWRLTPVGVSGSAMSEALIDLAEQESGNDVPSEESDDRLLTTRLPPITPPPLRPPSVPPSAMPTQPPFAPSGTIAPSPSRPTAGGAPC